MATRVRAWLQRGLPGRLWALLGPPKSLRQRIRWLFFIGAMWVVLIDELLLLGMDTVGWPQRVLAMGALGLLAAILGRGYRRGGFARWEPLLEGALLVWVGWTMGGAIQGQGLVFMVLFLRAQFGTLRDLWLLVGALSASYWAIAIALPLLLEVPLQFGLSQSVSVGFGIALMGWMMFVVSNSSLRQERAVARERTLASAGAEILAAGSTAEVYAIALRAAQALVDETPIRQITLRESPAAAAAPDPLITVVPLQARTARDEALVIETTRPLPAEYRAALGALVAQVSLGLDSLGLIDDLRLRDRALAAASSPVAITDAKAPGHPVRYVNAGFERTTGFTPSEVFEHGLCLLAGDDADHPLLGQLARVIADGKEETRELACYRKDGRLLWLEVAAAPVLGPDGQVSHCVWVLNDCTLRKAAEAQAAAVADVDKLRALGQMASGIAHDLNQSLMLIVSHGNLGQTALAGPSADLEDLKETLTVMTQSALDGGNTVKRLLLFARASEGEAQTVDLAALSREVAQLTTPRWRDAAIELTLQTTGHPLTSASESRVREALTSVILNAVDALPQGGTIRVRVFQDGPRACVEVADNGIGMTPEVQARIFEPFYSTKGDNGAGLGLATVFGVLDALGGRIHVESVPGQGSLFRLEFPAITLVPSAAAVPAPTATPAPSAPPANREKRRLRILAVDDEPAITRVVARMLRPAGHTVVTAESGETALERLAAESFDLVLSDLGMGVGMTGWDLAERVRAEWPEVRFVLATGWGATIEPAEARARGVEAVLAKPYDLADLVTVLDAA